MFGSYAAMVASQHTRYDESGNWLPDTSHPALDLWPAEVNGQLDAEYAAIAGEV